MNALETALNNARLREERAKEQAKEAAAKRQAERLSRRRRFFIQDFFAAVAKRADQKKWSLAAVQAVKDYAETLVCCHDHEIPSLDLSLAEVVQSCFAYGIMLCGEEVAPEGFFLGQRQEWFAPAFIEAKAAHQRRSEQKSQLELPAKLVGEPGDAFNPVVDESAADACRKIASAPKLVDKPATTPRKKRTSKKATA